MSCVQGFIATISPFNFATIGGCTSALPTAMVRGSMGIYPARINLIKNNQAVKKGAAPKKAMVKKDVKSKVAAKKWL